MANQLGLHHQIDRHYGYAIWRWQRSCPPQELLKFKPLSSQSHSKENKSWSINLAKNLRQPLINLISEFIMMTETITTQAGNTTTGNWRVFQSESNLVQRMSKRTKSDVFSDTMVKNSTFSRWFGPIADWIARKNPTQHVSKRFEQNELKEENSHNLGRIHEWAEQEKRRADPMVQIQALWGEEGQR